MKGLSSGLHWIAESLDSSWFRPAIFLNGGKDAIQEASDVHPMRNSQ